MMFTSSELLAAMSRSELLMPASSSSLGLAPLPAITSASSSSAACSTSFSSFSTSTTLWPSCESMRAVLSPTSPAPMITVCTAGNLLLAVGPNEWGFVQGLLGSSYHEHVPFVQYGVALGQGPGTTLRLEDYDRQAQLLREIEFGEGLVEPLFRDLGFDQGLVFSEVDVVEQDRRGHRPRELLSYLQLRLYYPVGAYPLEHPRVDAARGPRHDPGYSELLQGGRREDAGLDMILAYHHGGGVEAFDVQAPYGIFICSVSGHEVDVRQVISETLYHVLALVYGEYFVPQ